MIFSIRWRSFLWL